nr:radical SAM protein [Candidatus Sigynarchaeota archaeon]
MECIRVSIGSAAVLGLGHVRMEYPPTTIHLLQYSKDGCRANCGFCPQARDSVVDKKMLSRVSWPAFPWQVVKERIVSVYPERKFQRVCIQTVVYPAFKEDLITVASGILSAVKIPVSVALVPVSKNVLVELHDIGVERVGIA